jgi:hypothetical protein
LRIAEQQRKEKKDLIDAAAKQDEIGIRQAEAAARIELDAARLGVDIEKHKTDVEIQKMVEGSRVGLELTRTLDQQRSKQTKE